MAVQNVPERRLNRRYTVVLVPEGQTRKPLTVSFSLIGLVLVMCGTVVVLMGLVVAAIMYTPLGSRLPIHNAELEQRYGRQIIGIEDQLRSLAKEMMVLRAYNVKLRRALGENVDSQDSVAARNAAIAVDRSTVNESGAQPDTTSADEVAIASRLSNDGQTEQPVRVDVGVVSAAARMVELPLDQPVEGFVSRGFAPAELHYGVDFAGKQGTIVLAAADGNVVFAGWTYDNGFMIIISHEAGLMTIYKHNKALLKYTGAVVKRGEAIALLGNTGVTSSGPHLHFEVWKDGVAQDPMNYLLNIQ